MLVTHNSDYSQPFKQHLGYLNDTKILHWFAQNPLLANHPKLSAIPLGLESARLNRASPEGYLEARQQALTRNKEGVVLNFTPRGSERQGLLSKFANVSWATIQELGYGRYQGNGTTQLSSRELHGRFLVDMSQYRFAISPQGNGLDCHRIWEMLVIGVMPIVRRSNLDPLFDDLPVLLVDDWSEITKEKLDQHWGKHGASLIEKEIPAALTMRYWTDKIYSVKG